MTARSWVLLTVFIGICATRTASPPDASFSFVAAAHAQSLQQDGPVVDEIARLRNDIDSEEEIERLNASLFWLVRNYTDAELFALLKEANVQTVIVRGEVEAHLERLALAKRALRLRYGSNEIVAEKISGMSEAEIISFANAP